MNWELNLRYPPRSARTTFSIREVWIKPDGSVDHESNNVSGYADAGWTNSYHSAGWGNTNGGHWQRGSYRVDLFVDNRKVVTGQFEIID